MRRMEGEEVFVCRSINLLGSGAAFMLMAFFCQNITLASQDYRIILLVALACMSIADVCFAGAAYRGGSLRFIAILMASPSLFIIWDFLRRAPYAFAK